MRRGSVAAAGEESFDESADFPEGGEVVVWDVLLRVFEDVQVVQGLFVSLSGSLPEPVDGSLCVLRDAAACKVEFGEYGLGGGMALLRGFFEPEGGLFRVRFGGRGQPGGEVVLGLNESLFGGFVEPMEGFLPVGFHSTAFFIG